MNNLPLPAALQLKLDALAGHVRRLRFVRGVSLVVLVLALGFIGVFLADLALDLTEEALSPLLTGLVIITAVTALAGLVLPLCRRVDVEALAALIEKKYPELGERLTSSVELTKARESHGAAAFIAFLLEETEKRSRALVFRHAFPARSTRRLAITALVVLGLAFLPALVAAERYGDFSQRFLLCWFAPPALQFEVAPGDGYAALGRPLAWTVVLTRRDDRIAWPQTATLILKDKSGRKKQVLMQIKGDPEALNNQSLTCSIEQVADSFDYYIDAGGTRSATFSIQAVEPVVLASKPIVTVSPPPYVDPDKLPVTKRTDPGHVAAVQFGQVSLTLPLNRAPVKAAIQVTEEVAPGQKAKMWTVPVQVDSANTGSAMLPMFAAGSYRLLLHMEAEQSITTEQDLPGLTVRADHAPTFTAVPGFYSTGATDGKTSSSLLLDYGHASSVAPDAPIHLKAAVADEEGIGSVEVEYRINKGPVQSETIATSVGALDLKVDHLLKIQGKVKEGDIVHFRLRVGDNRNLKAGQFADADGVKVPAAALTPQVVYYPSVTDKDQWLTLKVDAKAGSPQEMEITAQKDAVQKQIDEIKERIEQERKDLAQLEQFGKNHPYWTVEQGQQLAKLRKDNHSIKSDLVDLALKTLPIPELNPISLQTYQIAKEEMTKSDEALTQAQDQKGNAAARDKQLARADQELEQALKKLDALKNINDILAKDRLDELKIQQLAQKEEDLSKQVAALEAKKPLDDPKLQAELQKLQADQQKVADELKQMAQQKPSFQAALQKAQAQQAQQLAMEAQKLAQAQQDLADKMQQALNEQQKSLLEEFAKKQQAIADKVSKLGQTTLESAKDRQLTPLNSQPAQEAVASLKKAAVTEALGDQEKSAKELERLAEGLDSVLNVTGEPVEVIKKLFKKQKEIEDRLLDEASKVALRTPQQLVQAIKDINVMQSTVHEAAQKLAATEPAYAEVHNLTGQAMTALQKFDTLQAWKDIEQARLALDQLSRFPPAAKIAPKPNPAPPGTEDVVTQQANQLRDLATEQWELRKQLQKLLANPDLASANGKGNPLEKMAQKQKDLQQQGKDLMDKLKQLAQAHGDSPEAKKPASDAAKSGEQALSSMKQAQDQGEKGKGQSAKQAADEAAKMLAEAAKQADQTAAKLGMPKQLSKSDQEKMNNQKQMSEALKQGQEQAGNAQDQLKQGELSKASQSMKQASESLKQAAQQMAKQSQQSKGGMTPAMSFYLANPAGALPDLAKYGDEGKQHTGKAWGQLPGQLKSKIMADMRAQYGEEYAAIIQRYFEEQATGSGTKKGN